MNSLCELLEISIFLVKVCCLICSYVFLSYKIRGVINYIDETSRSIKTRIYEYIRDFRNGEDRNVLVKHKLKTKHRFNLKDVS